MNAGYGACGGAGLFASAETVGGKLTENWLLHRLL